MARWKTVEGYPDYQVSDSGEVMSLKSGTPSLMALNLNKDTGYFQIQLMKDGKRRGFRINRLVADAFIPNPDGLPIVNHIDEDKSNNNYTNLEWCTSQYNNEYSHSKTYTFIDPDGNDVTVFNLDKFCRENNLCLGSLNKVAKGERNSCYGWRYRP